MKLHKSITRERIISGAENAMFGDETDGVCIACGEDAYGVEPDARRYRCDCCGQRAVFGWPELLISTVA